MPGLRRWIPLAASGVLLAACGPSSSDHPNVTCADFEYANCVLVPAGDEQALLDAVNALGDDSVVILGAGTYELDNQVTIRGANSIALVGQGIGESTLAFGSATAQINGVDVVADDFLIQDLTVLDAPKDGIRVEDSDGVTFRRIETTWTEPEQSTNGAYGIYPVRSRNVLVENSIASNASDAGLYVGQCINVIVRSNEVRGNVAGLEIENTQFADVYENLAENNTAGIVVFDLPGNPVVGRDVRMRSNIIRNNNTRNFAPGGVVAVIPAGTGTFALASRRVEITDNTYENNDTTDIAILSGLVIEPAERWELDTAALVGTWEDLGLLPGSADGRVTNFRSENIVVAGNTHSGSGTNPDIKNADAEFGSLLFLLYGPDGTVDSVLYDTFGESMFDPNDPTLNSNDNHLCVGGNTDGTFASLDFETQFTSAPAPFLSLPTAPFAPFDCTELDGGPVAAVTLE
jgi:parallel beta-helix repeat protein